MRAKRKKKADAVPELTEFEAAKAKWKEVGAEHADLVARIEGMRLARNQAATDASLDVAGHMPPHLVEKAKPYTRLASRRPARAADNLAVAEIELEE